MVDLSRWPDADEILDQALSRPPDERRAYVRSVAGHDPALAEAIEAVLEEAEHDDAFLTPGGAMAGPLAGDLAGIEAARGAPRLRPGDRFGAYQVLAVIGEGGMGEVYRARDTRLARDVALKVLPTRFAADPERHGRFEREARLLASLNHPHIAAIYDVEEHHGAVALILELVEGPTLGDRLRSGRLPIDEALGIAAQIVLALEAAHRRGVVHRDLKPANVKLTPSGEVKVLDFGIAKAIGSESGPPRQADLLSTASGADGQPRAMFGTAPYVSPEQARGRPTDHRADIWAFGCVLYELLTGTRAFDGATTTEVIARVLERDPDFSRLPRRTPPALRRLLVRTLRKDPARRLGYIGDALLDIEDARAELEGRAVNARQPGEAWRAAALVGGMALVLGIAGGATAMWRQMRPAPPLPTHLAVAVSEEDDLVAGELPGIAIAPDGRTIVYRARRDGVIQLVRHSLEDGSTEPIPGSVNGAGPFFSPDGRWLGFTGEAQLLKVPAGGGQPVVLCDAPGGARASWAPDDTLVFSTGAGRELYRVGAAGGEAETITRRDAASGHLSYESPFVLPGGRHALVTILLADGQQVGVVDLSTGSVRALTAGRQPRYVATGHIVLTRGDALWAAPFDLPALELGGEAVSMVAGLELGSLNGTAHFDISRDGTLVFMPRRPALALRTPVWVDREGREQALPVEPRAYTRASLSPDGTRLALALAAPENRDIWIHDLARGTFMRLTVHPATDTAPVWSPDGRSIAFRSDRDGGGLFMMSADGAGEVARLTRADGASRPAHTPYAFTPDGGLLLFTELRSYSDQGIGAVDLSGDRPAAMILDGPYAETRPSLSPDGRWVAYQSDESGRYEVYVRPFPAVDSGRTQVSIHGGTSPRWSSDGREIVFHDGNAMVAVRVRPGEPAGFDPPVVLFEASRYGERLGPLYDISPDGQRFLFLREGGADGAAGRRADLRVVQHWTERLRQRFGGG